MFKVKMHGTKERLVCIFRNGFHNPRGSGVAYYMDQIEESSTAHGFGWELACVLTRLGLGTGFLLGTPRFIRRDGPGVSCS